MSSSDSGPRVNEPELRRVLEFITEHEDRHDQENWIALARNAGDAPELYDVYPTVRDGDSEFTLLNVPVLQEEQVWSCGTAACLAGWTVLLNGWRPVGDDPESVFKDGVAMDVRTVARDLLWLDDGQADELFDPDNSVEELWDVAAALSDDRIEPPPERS